MRLPGLRSSWECVAYAHQMDRRSGEPELLKALVRPVDGAAMGSSSADGLLVEAVNGLRSPIDSGPQGA